MQSQTSQTYPIKNWDECYRILFKEPKETTSTKFTIHETRRHKRKRIGKIIAARAYFLEHQQQQFHPTDSPWEKMIFKKILAAINGWKEWPEKSLKINKDDYDMKITMNEAQEMERIHWYMKKWEEYLLDPKKDKHCHETGIKLHVQNEMYEFLRKNEEARNLLIEWQSWRLMHPPDTKIDN